MQRLFLITVNVSLHFARQIRNSFHSKVHLVLLHWKICTSYDWTMLSGITMGEKGFFYLLNLALTLNAKACSVYVLVHYFFRSYRQKNRLSGWQETTKIWQFINIFFYPFGMMKCFLHGFSFTAQLLWFHTLFLIHLFAFSPNMAQTSNHVFPTL